MIFIIVIVAGIAVVVANYMWQRERNRKEEEHERRIERYNKLLQLLKKPNDNQDESKSSGEGNSKT